MCCKPAEFFENSVLNHFSLQRKEHPMDEEKNKTIKRKHDPFFRWLFADTNHAKTLLELSGKVNAKVDRFLSTVNLDTLVRIPDSYSNVGDTGEGDLAFRVSVMSGAPVLVGIVLEHKSGNDPDTLNQVAKYVSALMKMHGEQRGYDLIPTMAIIFYNGRTNWDPFKKLVEGYPEDYQPSMLPFMHAFVNMADIPDSDCLACEDIATGMGIIAMKYAYNKDKLLEILPQFNEKLRKLPRDEASCLWQKINIYLAEYLGKDIFKELDMAFVSIGQKYGFESAGDYFRKQIAEAEEKGEAKGETKGHDDAISVLQDMGFPPEKIAEAKARLDALKK